MLSDNVAIAPDVKADDATPFEVVHVIVPNDGLTVNSVGFWGFPCPVADESLKFKFLFFSDGSNLWG